MVAKAKWPTKRLADLGEFRNGVNYNNSSFGEGVKVVGVSDFQDYTKPKYAELEQINPDGIVTERNILRDGDIVFVRSNGNRELIGRSLLIEKPPEEVTHSAFTIRLRFTSREVHPKFYAYCFRTPLIRQGLTAQGGGTNINNLNQDSLNALEVPFPPLPVQQRIADILSAYDDLIENNQRRIKILKEMARSLYREWFVNFRFPGHENVPLVDSPLGKIPRGWEVRTVEALASFLNRGLSPKYNDEGPSLVINQKCVRDQKINLEPARRQEKPIPNEKLVEFGDVLINSTGVGTLGRVAQVYGSFQNCTVDTHVTIVRPKKTLDVDYFGLALLNEQETFERAGTGATGQTELSRSAIGSVWLIVPPQSLQAHFGECVHSMRSFVTTLLKTNENLRRTRDLLLPRLLSGDIRFDDVPREREAGDHVTPHQIDAPPKGINRPPAKITAIKDREVVGYKVSPKQVPVVGNKSNGADEAPPRISETERSDVLSVIRQVFNDGQPRERDFAIRDVAYALGYGRTGHAIQEVLHTDLMTAVRRGILENVRGELKLRTRKVEDYDRDFLKEQFLAAIGRTWTEREDAIRDFARWLGFLRAGRVIEDTARSVINGLLREERLEADGSNLIRRV